MKSSEDDEIINRTAEIVFANIPTNGSLAGLSPQNRTFALVHWAQALIDNGGFGMFFDSDCPGRPSYRDFANAYREIGAREMAELIERGAALFEIPDPHLHPDKRSEILERYFDAEQGSPWDNLDTPEISRVSHWLAVYARGKFFAA